MSRPAAHVVRGWRAACVTVVAVVMAVVLGGCTSFAPTSSPSSTGDAERGPGGTLRVLTAREDLSSLDPQRLNGSFDSAFLGDFLHRTLVRYSQSTDPEEQSFLVADLATDTGTANADHTSWTFTLRDDARWADGAPVTCEDVAYGVSRQFAVDLLPGGPALARAALDLPRDADGAPRYQGPYVQEGQSDFDRAVSCSSNRITFRLASPSTDFPEALAHPSFSPVRVDQDTGERYGQDPMASGPYEVVEYTRGDRLVLRRNANWQAGSDPHRPANPDEVVVELAVPESEIASRLAADDGRDRFAVVADDSSVAAVSEIDADEGRSWLEAMQTITYLAVNTQRLPVVEHRRALLAATDRRAAASVLGRGETARPADGLVAPGLVLDYSPTEVDDLLGQQVPDEGDPVVAAELIASSGQAMPEITIDYPDLGVAAAQVDAVAASLSAAGIGVVPNPLPADSYYSTIVDADGRGHLSWLPWRPDWANASQVIGPLLGEGETFNLSAVNEPDGVQDEELAGLISAALGEPDRERQAALHQEANTRAVAEGYVVPLTFTQSFRAWGSGLSNVFYHSPLESYAFAQITVRPPPSR